MTIDRRTLWIAGGFLFVGLWLGGWRFDSNPFAPRPERPILAAILKLARTALWVAAFADPPPAEPAHDPRFVQARGVRIGDDGHPVVDHGRGL